MDNNYFPDDMVYWGEKPYVPPQKEKKRFRVYYVRSKVIRNRYFPAAEVFLKSTTYFFGIPIKSRIKKLK